MTRWTARSRGKSIGWRWTSRGRISYTRSVFFVTSHQRIKLREKKLIGMYREFRTPEKHVRIIRATTRLSGTTIGLKGSNPRGLLKRISGGGDNVCRRFRKTRTPTRMPSDGEPSRLRTSPCTPATVGQERFPRAATLRNSRLPPTPDPPSDLQPFHQRQYVFNGTYAYRRCI